jgi:GR25 family glycosyltransferase involved in LPS biosynthesis
MKSIIILLLSIIIILSFAILVKPSSILNYFAIKEGYSNYDMDMYVISLRHDNRMNNISNQESKINKKINIFDAVKGDNIIEKQLIDSGELSPKNMMTDNEKIRKRGIGCYLSHLNILKKIKETKNVGYTIIFEDDFDIKSNDFLSDVTNILNKLDDNFDMIYLGNITSSYGDKLDNNIYYVNKNQTLIGLHGYLINNSRIDKIIPLISYIDEPIDLKYERLSKENKIQTYLIYPTLVDQGGVNNSTINDLTIENFSFYE